MEFALLGAIFVGLTLGLLGSGGSILTVPVLLYILQRPEKLAIAESLAIVGAIALLGAIPYMKRTQVHWTSVFFFGLPGMLGACIGGNCSYYCSGKVQLIFFSITMLIVAAVMLFGPSSFEKFTPSHQAIWKTLLEGFLIGLMTGLFGVGGGFLIVPALVMLCNLSMTLAVGTSLVIIAVNSITGFIQQLISLHALQMDVDWNIIFMISTAGILGSMIGGFMSHKISQFFLRKAFGVSVLLMGFYILFSKI
jgi:uncharacterized protein